MIDDALPVLARIFIVWIFPFSFLDKVINWDDALKQATSSWLPGGPVLLILAMIASILVPARADSLRVELTGINYKTSMLFNLAGLGVIIILIALYGYLWDVP